METPMIPLRHIYKDGSYVWYIPDETIGEIDDKNSHKFRWHREDGPAYYEPVGNYEYWYNNKLHRYDGPAHKETIDKTTTVYWKIHGHTVDPIKYCSWLLEMGMDIENLTNEDKVLIDLKWTM